MSEQDGHQQETPEPEVQDDIPAAAPESAAEGADETSDAPALGDAPQEGAEPAAAEEAPKPKKERKDWREIRLEQEYARRKELEDRVRELEARHAAPAEGTEAPPAREAAGSTLTPDQVRTEAARMVAEQRAVDAANRVFEDGVKAHPDFVEKRDALVNALGDTLQRRPDFLEAITALPNGHDVFHAFASDLNYAAEVLTMPTARMAVELAKLSSEIVAPKARVVSGAPAPIKPLGGAAKGAIDLADPNLSDEEYYAVREKQREAAWKAKR